MGHNGCWGVMLLRNGSDEEGVPMYGYGRTVEELSWATEVRRKRCPNALLELATLYGLEDAVLESGIVANFTLQPSLAPVPAEGDANLYIRLDLIAGCRDENEFLYHAPTLDLGEAPILFVSTESKWGARHHLGSVEGHLPSGVPESRSALARALHRWVAGAADPAHAMGCPERWVGGHRGDAHRPAPGPSQHMRGISQPEAGPRTPLGSNGVGGSSQRLRSYHGE